jgi:hypothetical protein
MKRNPKTAQTYQDDYGNTKEFTFIDYDKKSKKSMSSPLTKEELEEIQRKMKDHTEKYIQEILSFPAVNAVKGSGGDIFETFVDRDKENGITWNEKVVRGACMIDPILTRNLLNKLWKSTVKEQYWFDDMSHEDIISGKWKDLT